MRNLSTRNRAHRRCLHGRHSSRLAVKRHELDLESPAVVVDMNHCPDIASLQAFVRDRCGEYHSIVFFDHAKGSLLPRTCCHEPRSFAISIDNPYRTDASLVLFSVRPQPSVDNVFLAVSRLGTLYHVAVLGNTPECGNEPLGFLDRKREGFEESRLTAVVRMSRLQQVLNDFVALDGGEMSIGELHASAVSHSTTPSSLADPCEPPLPPSLKLRHRHRGHSRPFRGVRGLGSDFHRRPPHGPTAGALRACTKVTKIRSSRNPHAEARHDAHPSMVTRSGRYLPDTTIVLRADAAAPPLCGNRCRFFHAHRLPSCTRTLRVAEA
jgi:hypothetical protein